MRLLTTASLVLLIASSASGQQLRGRLEGSPTEWSQDKVPTVSPAKVRTSGNLNGDASDHRCYFIRSYIFQRNDGEPPVFQRETTCTPANPNAVQRTRRSRARFVPLSR